MCYVTYVTLYLYYNTSMCGTTIWCYSYTVLNALYSLFMKRPYVPLWVYICWKRELPCQPWCQPKVLCNKQSGPSIDFGEELMPFPSIGPKLFRTSLKCLVQVPNRFSMLTRSENVFSLPNFTFWTMSKLKIYFGHVSKTIWTSPKSFWTCRGTRQNDCTYTI